MKEMLQSYEAMRKIKRIGELGFSMTFYLDNITRAIKLQAGKFCLQRTVQHFSTLFNTVSTQLRSAQKQVKELNKIELCVNAKTFQPQQNAEAVAVVYMIGEMKE